MRMFNWAEAFKKQPTCDDILKRVRKTEIKYWIFLVVSIVIVIDGFAIMQNAADDDLKKIALGLFVAIAGIVQVALIKLWAHIRLTTYYVIWDRNNTIEAEIRKSESEDI